MTRTSRRQPSRSASRIIRPRRGSIGSRARRRPSRVSARAALLAPVADCLRRQRAELLEQLDARGDVAPVGRLHEREAADVAEPQRGHLQDHRGQVGAQDLGVGERRAALEVLLGVQPDRDAGLDPAAATRALGGGGLADRLDRQPLHLGAHGVARDPGDAGVHDVPDARARSARSPRRWWPARRGVRCAGRRPCAARRRRAGSRAARSRAAGRGAGRSRRRRARRRCRGSRAPRAGRPGCRRGPRRRAPGPRRRSPRSGRGRRSRPPHPPRRARPSGR